MKNNNVGINHINKYNSNTTKKEWENIFNDTIIVRSINNGIDPIINILIESIDKFSFGEGLDEENVNDLINIYGPNNYLSIIYKQNNEQDLIKNIDDIMDYNIFNLNNNKKNEKKICGIVSKEDFDIKIKPKHNNQLNYSFEKKFYNPLNDNNELYPNENNIYNYTSINHNNNNGLSNSNSYNIYEDNSNKKENGLNKNIEIANSNNNKVIPSNDIKYNEIEFNKDINDIIPSIRDQVINYNKINNNYKYRNKSENGIISNNEKISPRYIDKLLKEENKEIKREDKFYQDNINTNKYDTLKDYVKDNVIPLPIYFNDDETIFSPLDLISERKEELKELENNKENDNNKKIVINPISFNKLYDIDVKRKLIELSEKVQQSENNIKIIKNTNEKLIEIINNFKNHGIIGKEKNKNSNSGQNSPMKIPLKRRCYSPSINNINNIKKNEKKNIKKDKLNSNHKKAKSFSKLKVFIDTNNSEKKNNITNYNNKNKNEGHITLNKNINTYSQIYNREKYNKKYKYNKLYNYKKIKNNKFPLIRHTIFLTGNSNKNDINYNDINNINNTNINYKKILNEIDKNNQNSINYKYLNDYSFPSSRKNQNNSNILTNYQIGNIYQRQIMKLPPHKQPLFYESNTNSLNNIMYDYNNNNNKDYNYNDTFSFKEQKVNFDEKFSYVKINMPNKISERYKNGINGKYFKKNRSREKQINNNNYRTKLLNFKDFQVIFEEKEKNSQKKRSLIDENIINQAYIQSNSYRNKYIEKNLINNNNFKNIHFPCLKNKLYKINNCKKKNNNNNFKENGKVSKYENIINENGNPKENKNINKYSDYINKKYKTLFTKQINNNNEKKYNGKITNNNNINKNNFMIPFYLINNEEFYLNILNSSNNKTKFK